MTEYKRIGDDPPTDYLSNGTWRPWPMRTPIIVTFAALCIALCTSIEVIYTCSLDGCRIFGTPSTMQTSPSTYFVYNLLPTIISVCFSLLWTVVHHDVVRLEPYIQMSTLDGAVAEDSVLLDYSYMFSPSIPVVSMKRRHYVVFLSSCILLLINLFITPLTSGIFDDVSLTKHIQSPGIRGFIKSGSPKFSPRFAYVAYNYHWANGLLPKFTTPTYALLPVNPGTLTTWDNETWNAESTLYEADLVCKPALITPIIYPEVGKVGLNITSALSDNFSYVLWDGGVVDKINLTTKYNLHELFPVNETSDVKPLHMTEPFVTPWTSVMVPINIDNGIYLFIWASSTRLEPLSPTATPGLPRNITAAACTASYYSQPVTADFIIQSGNITNAKRIGNRTPFINGEGFISTVDGRIVDGRTWPFTSFSTKNATYKNGLGSRPIKLPNVDSQLKKCFGPRPVSLDSFVEFGNYDSSNSSIFMDSVYTLPAFSLYNQTFLTLQDLLDQEVLTEIYKRELKLLFALAVSLEMVDDIAAEAITVTRKVFARGFRVKILWARGAQGGLAIVAIMAIVMSLLLRRRGCMLDGEPNSLGAALQLLASSPEMCVEVENSEFHAFETLREVLVQGKRRYKLVTMQGCGPKIVVAGGGGRIRLSSPDHKTSKIVIDKTTPWAIRASAGVQLLLFFTVITILLIAIYGCAYVNSGLPIFGGANSFTYKILFSYIPFVISMAVEPLLIGLGSYYCMLGPYESLRHIPHISHANHLYRRRHISNVECLTIDYERSPPHFQLLRSLRCKDATLAALTISIILCNILAVALGALFSVTLFEFSVKIDIQRFRPPHIKGGFTDPANAMYYILAANISDGNQPPPWTTEEYFVVPFSGMGHSEFQGPTIGISVDIKCSVVQRDMLILLCDDGRGLEKCASDAEPGNILGMDIDDPCMRDSSIHGGERTYFWLGENRILRSAPCPNTFFAGWVERSGAPDDNILPQATVLKCTSIEVFYEITAAINETNQVLSATMIRLLNTQETTVLYPENSGPGNLSSTFVEAMKTTLNPINGYQDLEWFTYLLVAITPSIMKPLTKRWRIPDDKKIVVPFESLYRRLFAINLSLYQNDILSFGIPYLTPGTASVQKERVHMSLPMMVVTLSILLYIITVLVVLYWWNRPHVPQPMPTSLAGMYAHLYASNARVQINGRTPKERGEKFQGHYAYGDFEGVDGRRHVGVYRKNIKIEEGDCPVV